MDREIIMERLFPILQEDFSDVKISQETNIEILQMDSIYFVKFIIRIEDEFDVEISNEDLSVRKYRTIRDFVDMIIAYTSEEGHCANRKGQISDVSKP